MNGVNGVRGPGPGARVEDSVTCNAKRLGWCGARIPDPGSRTPSNIP